MSAPTYPIVIKDLAYREAGADYDIAPHVHYMHQWYCLIEGDVCMRLGEEEVRLSATDSVIIDPGMVRGPYCVGRSPRYIVCQFENRDLNLSGLAGQRLLMPARLDEDLLALMGELREPGFPNPFHLRYALLTRLLVGLRRRHQERRAPDPSPLNARAQHEVVEQVDIFLRTNIDRSLNCQRIAAAVHVSAPHLNRLLRAHTGMSINQRLIHWRIEQAKHLLLESSFSISQIAQLVGLSSFSYFTKLFTKQVGSAPSTYRRLHGQRYVARDLRLDPDGPPTGAYR